MSSDSSDEENLDLLREAQDLQFINDSMFSDRRDTITFKEDKIVLPSLRKAKDEDEQFNLFRVSPEFRKYVAKQLSALLDEQISYKKHSKNTTNHIDRLVTGGVKLLSESDNYLEVDNLDGESLTTRTNNRSHSTRGNTVQISEDCLRQIVVSGEDILSGNETRYWSNRSKAPVFEYKPNENGQLVLIEPAFK